MSISLIFNENFNIQLKKSSNRIEGKYNDFFNFRNKKAGINVIESTPNFEIKNISKGISFSTLQLNIYVFLLKINKFFKRSDTIFDHDHLDHDRPITITINTQYHRLKPCKILKRN